MSVEIMIDGLTLKKAKKSRFYFTPMECLLICPQL